MSICYEDGAIKEGSQKLNLGVELTRDGRESKKKRCHHVENLKGLAYGKTPGFTPIGWRFQRRLPVPEKKKNHPS